MVVVLIWLIYVFFLSIQYLARKLLNFELLKLVKHLPF